MPCRGGGEGGGEYGHKWGGGGYPQTLGAALVSSHLPPTAGPGSSLLWSPLSQTPTPQYLVSLVATKTTGLGASAGLSFWRLAAGCALARSPELRGRPLAEKGTPPPTTCAAHVGGVGRREAQLCPGSPVQPWPPILPQPPTPAVPGKPPLLPPHPTPEPPTLLLATPSQSLLHCQVALPPLRFPPLPPL